MSGPVDYEARRAELRQRYWSAPDAKHTTGIGVNHLALICSDIERTIESRRHPGDRISQVACP